METIPRQEYFSGKRIVLYGPESTGKSTLSRKLAQHFHTTYIQEYARDYLQEKWDKTGQIATYEDIMPIAIAHRQAENQALDQAQGYLFCDTDVLETYVYCMAYFNTAPPQLKQAVIDSHYDVYLLLDIDIPWVEDDLRDRPDQRLSFYNRFEQALIDFNKPYKKISGLDATRTLNAINAIETL